MPEPSPNTSLASETGTDPAPKAPVIAVIIPCFAETAPVPDVLGRIGGVGHPRLSLQLHLPRHAGRTRRRKRA